MEDKKNTINIKKNKMMVKNVMPKKQNVFQAIEEEKYIQELQKTRREKKLDKDKERVIT